MLTTNFTTFNPFEAVQAVDKSKSIPNSRKATPIEIKYQKICEIITSGALTKIQEKFHEKVSEGWDPDHPKGFYIMWKPEKDLAIMYKDGYGSDLPKINAAAFVGGFHDKKTGTFDMKWATEPEDCYTLVEWINYAFTCTGQTRFSLEDVTDELGTPFVMWKVKIAGPPIDEDPPIDEEAATHLSTNSIELTVAKVAGLTVDDNDGDNDVDDADNGDNDVDDVPDTTAGASPVAEPPENGWTVVSRSK